MLPDGSICKFVDPGAGDRWGVRVPSPPAAWATAQRGLADDVPGLSGMDWRGRVGTKPDGNALGGRSAMA